MKINSIMRIAALSVLIVLASYSLASAYWVWTPETKKFLNPKYAVKDSPKEQYDWAMSFYDAKDYPRAVTEFDKLTKSYEFSEYAGMAQYHIGLSYENMGKYYLAFQAYQKAVENFPHLDNVDEIIAREFNIANIYSTKENPKVLGTDIMTPTDRVVEIYRKVVENSPYGKLADESLFNMGTVLKGVERYDEAIPAFQKILDEYPDSQFTERARYEVAYCAYKASLKPAYDQASTDNAIRAFTEFSADNKDTQLTQEADKTIQRLKDKAAEKSIQTAQFYEKIKKKESAIIYYKDIINRYPDCSYIELAKTKIEELKSGKKIVTARAPTGGIFGMWSAKTPPETAEIPQEAIMQDGSVQTEQAKAGLLEKEKKGWMPFSFGKKDAPKGKEVKSAEATASMPKKRGWSPLNFSRKEAPDKTKAQPGEPPVSRDSASIGSDTVPEASQPSAAPAADPYAISEPASTQPSTVSSSPIGSDAGTAPAPVSQTPGRSIRESAPEPIISGSARASTPYKPKKKGWNLIDILGFGSDDPKPDKKAASKSAVPDAQPVAEPLSNASDPAPSTDDPNLDKDDYIY